MPKRLRSEDEENFGVLVKNHISDREVNMGVLKVGYIHSFSLLLLLSLLFLLIWGGGQYLRAQGGYLSLLLFFLSFCAFCLWITTIWRVQHRLWKSRRNINFKVLNSSPPMILFPELLYISPSTLPLGYLHQIQLIFQVTLQGPWRPFIFNPKFSFGPFETSNLILTYT